MMGDSGGCFSLAVILLWSGDVLEEDVLEELV